MSAILEIKLSEEQLEELAERIARKVGGPKTPGRPLTVKETAAALGVSVSTVHLRIRSGLIRKVPDIGATRVSRAEINRLLAEPSDGSSPK